MKYWLTFNEINIMLHSPYSGAGLVFEEGENREQVKYQAAHHELVASALATKIAHEINPQNQVGCMLAGGNSTLTPASRKMYGWRWRRTAKTCSLSMSGPRRLSGVGRAGVPGKGVTIAKQPGDDEILKTPSISSPLATTRRAAPRRR